MKICITAAGEACDSAQDPRFGRCEAFYIYDSETKEGYFIKNPYKGAVGGAGVRAAELVVKEGAGLVISGHLGPNAWDVLAEADVKVYTTQKEHVQAVLDAYLGGELQELKAPDSAGHSGGRA